MESIEQIHIKVDSKGSIRFPGEIRQEIGDTATLKRTRHGFLLLPGKKEDAKEKLSRIIQSKHKRAGKPEN